MNKANQMRQLLPKLMPAFLLGTLAMGAVACSPAGPRCQKELECKQSPSGQEFVQVCAARLDGELNQLRANTNDVCHKLANAKSALWACEAALECRDFRESDLNSRCVEEREAASDFSAEEFEKCSYLKVRF